MKRILLTGVTGQVGGALRVALEPLGTVLAADRKVLDLSKPDSISRVLDELAPDLIINPAAYTAVDRAEDDQELAYCINATAPEKIARWSAKNRVPLVHFSTDYVFDGLGNKPWAEGDPTRPISVYGRSKLAGEEHVRAAGGPHLVVRTSWVYAAFGINFMQTIIRLARSQRELRIVDDQIGAPTTASLIGRSIVAILREDETTMERKFAQANGLVHLTANGCTSWYSFANAIVNELSSRGVNLAVQRVLPISSESFKTKAIRPKNSRLDLSRLELIFKVRPISWQDALKDEIEKIEGRLEP